MLLKLFLVSLAVFVVTALGLALGAMTGRRCVRSCSDCSTCEFRRPASPGSHPGE